MRKGLQCIVGWESTILFLNGIHRNCRTHSGKYISPLSAKEIDAANL